MHCAKRITIALILLLTQQAYAQSPGKITLPLKDSVSITFTKILPGKFMMGSPAWDTLAHSIERPQHEVTIGQAFYLGVTPVTIGQFKIFVAETGYRTVAETDGIGGHGYNETANKFEGLFPQYNWRHTGWAQNDQHPVVNVSWVDANKFCEWLSAKSGKKITLPTEEEWEYACRAGTSTLFFTGKRSQQPKRLRQRKRRCPKSEITRTPKSRPHISVQ